MRNICVDSKELSVVVVSGEAKMAFPVLVTVEINDHDGGACCIPLSHDQAVHFAAGLVEASILHCSPELQGKLRNLVRDLLRTTKNSLRSK